MDVLRTYVILEQIVLVFPPIPSLTAFSDCYSRPLIRFYSTQAICKQEIRREVTGMKEVLRRKAACYN